MNAHTFVKINTYAQFFISKLAELLFALLISFTQTNLGLRPPSLQQCTHVYAKPAQIRDQMNLNYWDFLNIYFESD